MIDLTTCNEWQHRDPSNGLVFPWYTKSFLDELKNWYLKDKIVLEIGGGASTIWWASKARAVYLMEKNNEYRDAVLAMNIPNIQCVNESAGAAFDIVIVDNDPVETRDEVCAVVIDCINPGGVLIVDNWDQPSVWVPSDETREFLSKYPKTIYPQDGHPDWKTAVFDIPY